MADGIHQRRSAICDLRTGLPWALLLTTSVIYFFSTNEADNDLWGHLLFGRDILATGVVAHRDVYAYTTTGQTWINHEWLSQVLFAAVYQWAGSRGLLCLKFIVTALTVATLLHVLRRRTENPVIWGTIGLLSIALLARGCAIRPQIFTYLNIALTLAILDAYQRGRRNVLWLLPPLFMIWVNLHGGFALGLSALGLFVMLRWISGSDRSVAPWLTLGGSTLPIIFNPNGFHVLSYVFDEVSRTHRITEWEPATIADVSQLVFFAMVGLFIVSLPFATRWRERGWELVLAAGAGVLAVRQQRHTPIFALCAAAPLAAQLETSGRWLRQRSSFALQAVSRRIITVALVAVAIVQVGYTGLRWRRDGSRIVFDPMDYPTEAVRAMKDAGVEANLAVPLDWGEYVLWFLAPRIKVSSDGRFGTVFPQAVIEKNFNFFSGSTNWRQLLNEYPTEAALVPAGSPCPIASLPDWQLVFDSPSARVYARVGTRAWPVLQQLAEKYRVKTVAGIFP